MKVKVLIVFCLLVAILGALSCAPTKAPAKAEVPAGYERIRIVGATLSGISSTAAMGIATILNKHYPEIEWSSTSGSTGTNPVFLTKGDIKLGAAGPGNYIDAYGFDKIPESRLRSITLPQPLSHYHFVIPEDKPWKDITEVPKGTNFSPGTPGTTLIVAAEAWLQLVGLSKKDFNWLPLGKTEAADAWRAGKVDIILRSSVGVDPPLMDMFTSPRKFKPMGLSPQQAAKAKAERTFERLGFEGPAEGTLSKMAPEIWKYDVVCPQQAIYLNARDDFSEEVAHKMAKVMDERNAEMTQIYSALKYANPEWHVKWARPPLDIHSGVAKYYREKGYLK